MVPTNAGEGGPGTPGVWSGNCCPGRTGTASGRNTKKKIRHVFPVPIPGYPVFTIMHQAVIVSVV